MKRMMKKVMATILALSMLIGLTGCMHMTEIIDLREKGKYSYSTEVKMNLGFMKEIMGEEYNEKELKNQMRETYKELNMKVDFEKDENDELWMNVKYKMKNLSKKELKKLCQNPEWVVKNMGLDQDMIGSLPETKEVRFVFNNKKFVLETAKADIADIELPEPDESELVDDVNMADTVEEMEDGTVTDETVTDEEVPLSESIDQLGESIAQMIDESDISSSTTIRFPRKVKKTNGRIKKDGKTVVWENTTSNKVYAIFK